MHATYQVGHSSLVNDHFETLQAGVKPLFWYTIFSLSQNWARIGSIHGLDWIERDDCDPFFISSTVDAIFSNYDLWFFNYPGFTMIKS